MKNVCSYTCLTSAYLKRNSLFVAIDMYSILDASLCLQAFYLFNRLSSQFLSHSVLFIISLLVHILCLSSFFFLYQLVCIFIHFTIASRLHAALVSSAYSRNLHFLFSIHPFQTFLYLPTNFLAIFLTFSLSPCEI